MLGGEGVLPAEVAPVTIGSNGDRVEKELLGRVCIVILDTIVIGYASIYYSLAKIMVDGVSKVLGKFTQNCG